MSEFRIHHHVSQLLSLLGASGTDGPEVYTEMLTKNMTPYVTTQVSAHTSKSKIAESSTTPREFLKKYDELKSKNIRELDPLVYLLSKVVDDRQMVSFLERNSKARTRARLAALKSGGKASVQGIQDAIPASGTMSQQELNELRSQLASASNVNMVGITPEEKLKLLREKQSKRTGNIPGAPSWVVERPYLSRDYVPKAEESHKKTGSIGTLPVPLQELAVVEDLLFLLMGVEGKYIWVKPLKDKYSLRTFTVDRTLDVSINELVQRILPVCSYYSTVCRFIEEKSSFEHGLVNHALCAAMRTLLKEYYVLVAQLEHQFRLGQLSLQKFWFYIQPCIRTLEILASISVSVDKGNCKGGSVLTLLHERTVSLIGDAKAQDLCLFLTQAACVPYFDTLEQWIYKGIINDPYSEFLVAEHGTVQKEKLTEDYNDAYWEQRYTVVRENIPIFLEKVAENILRTGKYLNVIRQCGRDVRCPDAEEIIYTLREREYVDKIEKAYNYASKTLLNVLMDEKELMARLSSIKHYFLMDLGDFFVQFMDLAEDEMRKNMDDIVPSRLETLLELALRTSTANSDPFKDDLRTELLPYDLITQLFRILSVAYDSRGSSTAFQQDPTELQISGLEAFSFDYVVKWPVSLILSKKALTKYQMLFRHLFYNKHVERQLCNVWLNNKKAKQFTLHSSPWYAAAFALRQRMLHFVQTFQHYMMFEVLEPNWHLMKSSLEEVTNIDGVLEHHNDFLDRCLKDCMLTNPDLLKNVSKLLLVCVTFTNCMQRFTQSASAEYVSEEAGQSPMSKRGPPPGEEEMKKTAAKAEADHMSQMMSGGDFESTIQNFDANFSRHLLDLLERLSHYSTTDCEHQMLNIIARLDHNGFYTAQLEKRPAEESIYSEGQDRKEPPQSQSDSQFMSYDEPVRESSSSSAALRSAESLENISARLKSLQKPVSMPDLSEGSRRTRR